MEVGEISKRGLLGLGMCTEAKRFHGQPVPRK